MGSGTLLKLFVYSSNDCNIYVFMFYTAPICVGVRNFDDTLTFHPILYSGLIMLPELFENLFQADHGIVQTALFMHI